MISEKKAYKIIDKLKDKAEYSSAKMPSIVKIHEMLLFFGINHWFHDKTGSVERRSKGARYVYERHEGKSGYNLELKDDKGHIILDMDSTDPYYSWNTSIYARKILEILKSHGINV